jgi:anaerobic selenocysteine-containing dehydrogenase
MEREVRTFCRVCEPSCGLVARIADGEVAELRPDKDHPVTQGFACAKGMAALDIHRDPDRLGQPLRRSESGFEATSWDTAVSEIAEQLTRIRDEHGPNSVAAYIGNPTAFNTLAGPAIGSLLGQLGVRRVFGSGTQDCANKFAGSEAVFGSSTIHPIPDIAHTDHLLVFGSNPRVSKMSFLSIADPMAELRAAKQRGATIRFINPRRIESAQASVGDVVLIRPDTDLYLMAALLCELERIGGFDQKVLREHGRNLDDFLAFIRTYPPERVAGVTGVAAEEIRAMAREFGEAKSASVYMSTGVNMGRQGTLAYWLLHMLSFVTGNLDRRGGNLYSLGFYPAPKAGRTDPEKHFFDSRYGRIRRVRGSLPGNLMPDMIADEDEPIHAMIVLAGNPVLSVGGEERMRAALEGLDLLVCLDLYRNATGELADYLLPCTDMLERPDINLCGLGMQHRPFVQFTSAAAAARDERKPEWWILGRIEQALGLRSVLDSGEPTTEQLFSRIDHMLAHSDLSIRQLAEDEGGTALLGELDPGRFYSDWIQTADSKVDCCPSLFSEALARADTIFCELDAEPAGQLKLITLRTNRMHNSWYQNVEKLRRGKAARNRLHMHPKDAADRGIEDGQQVRISNENGSASLEVALDSDLVRGAVALTHGGGNQAGEGMQVARRYDAPNPNTLLPSGPGSFEPLSSQAFMTGVPVDVARAGEA